MRVVDNSGDFAPSIDQGLQPGRIVGFVNVGTHADSRGKSKMKIRTFIEFPHVRIQNETEGDQPLVLSREFTMTLNEGGFFSQHFIDHCVTQSLTPEQRKAGIELREFLGIPVMVQVAHDVRNGKTYVNLAIIMKHPSPDTVSPT